MSSLADCFERCSPVAVVATGSLLLQCDFVADFVTGQL